ncbi:MAG: hypothetical protein HC882_01495 [Acidobacteria bacterium]|nr:hypothetical protein [Acidobacteriota bacterium]
MRSRLSRVFRRTTIAATFAVALAHAAIAQDDAECLICHEDRTLIATRDGQAVPAFVDEARLSRSVHASLECVSCHTDLAGSEAGHEDDVARVDCALCHDAEAALHARSLHGRAAARGDRLAPTCSRCHGTHEILSHRVRDSRTSVMNVPLLCGQCHREGSEVSETHEISQERILENYSMSIHGEGLFKKGLTVTAVCTSCHTAHLILDHDDPESSIHRRNVAATCTACHARIEDVHRRVIEGRLWRENPNAIPSCVDCHAPHRIRNPDYQAGAANKDCLACHANRELATTKAGRQVSLFVDEQIYHQTAHASVACAQCHTDVTVSLHRPCETVRSQVDCSICHAVEVEQFNTSTHGRLLAAHEPGAPTCLTCHGKHDIKDHLLPASPTYARNVPTLCGTCHARGQVAAERRARAGGGDIGTRGLRTSSRATNSACMDARWCRAGSSSPRPASTATGPTSSSPLPTRRHSFIATTSPRPAARAITVSRRPSPRASMLHARTVT